MKPQKKRKKKCMFCIRFGLVLFVLQSYEKCTKTRISLQGNHFVFIQMLYVDCLQLKGPHLYAIAAWVDLCFCQTVALSVADTHLKNESLLTIVLLNGVRFLFPKSYSNLFL